MEIGTITQHNIKLFQTLLLPEETEAIQNGLNVPALGITEDAIACGALSGWLNMRRFEIRSFYVAPDYRKKGGGRLLMETLLTQLSGTADTLEISYTRTRPEHDSLPPFLQKMGFSKENDRDENLYRIPLKELYQQPFFAKETTIPSNIKSFEKISPQVLERAYKQELGLRTAYLPYSLTDDQVDAKMSVALVRENDIEAFLAFDHSLAGHLTLAWTKGGKDPALLPALLRSAAMNARSIYPPEELLYVQAIDPVTAALMKKLVPAAEKVSDTYVISVP